MESLTSKKFQPLSQKEMKHIVGGKSYETAGGGTRDQKYSNDYASSTTDKNGKNVISNHVPNGGDWSHYYLEQAGVEKWLYTGDGPR